VLRRLYVDNYKCLVNFGLPLQDLTLLVGPNGAGKTAVLDVIFALRELLRGVAKVTDPAVFPSRTLTRWQSRDRQAFELEVELGKDVLLYRLEVQHERATQRARIMLESLKANGRPLFHCEGGEVTLYRDDHSEGPRLTVDWSESALARVAPRGDNRRLTRFLEFVRKMVVCGMYPPSFQAETVTEDPMLHRDARNFAAWFRNALLERQDLVPDFTKALEEVISGFAGIRLEKVGLDARALMVMFREHGERYELRLDEISDGQRALIALYSLVQLAAGQGCTLFLDEPDNYLALAEIQPWLMVLADGCGEAFTQAVLTSHHPELIDYLGGDRGVSLRRESSGVTTARRLDAAPVEGGLRLSEAVARGWER
jgi:predicted ATPase